VSNTKVEPMSILLLEDDIHICNAFESLINIREDVCLVAQTNSSFEAIKLAKKYRPECIIVDLELHSGYGTGFEFLTELRNSNLDFEPLVVVNTRVKPGIVYDGIHEGFADLIFYKQQPDYSIEYVINSIVFSRKKNSNAPPPFEIVCGNNLRDEEAKRLTKLINAELDAVGIKQTLRGREYLFYGIKYMLEEQPKSSRDLSPLNYVADKYDMFPSSVSRGIHTAINDAWMYTPIEDIEENYKARVNSDSGSPTAMEFIKYYYLKIKNLL